MRLSHEEQAKIRAAIKIIDIYSGKSRGDVRKQAEEIVVEVADVLISEELMV